jgi:hypothetical protein
LTWSVARQQSGFRAAPSRQCGLGRKLIKGIPFLGEA